MLEDVETVYVVGASDREFVEPLTDGKPLARQARAQRWIGLDTNHEALHRGQSAGVSAGAGAEVHDHTRGPSGSANRMEKEVVVVARCLHHLQVRHTALRRRLFPGRSP